MAANHFTNLVRDRLQEVANSSALAQKSILEQVPVSGFSQEELLRLLVELFEGVNEALSSLASEVDDLGDSLADAD